ncbi:GTP pyrophosphokinase [Rhynchospora pubera]|uniref:Putative GTP diphosphokinase RSH1, chloroplastic n=1 Tax=Rhynchospora pubera TaxID=906938 RepID=A0AAV8CGM1_9POAL|nr:GTP pyrophosphokinase [Rhynchospora pubera]
MAMFPSTSVLPGCLNLCKISTKKGESGARSWYECSMLSCAWKVPRVLTGSLASTPQSYHTDGTNKWRRRSWLRDGNHITWKVEGTSKRKSHPGPKSNLSVSKRFFGYESTHSIDMKWALSCSSSNHDSSDSMDSETLWESLKPSISYLAPDELNLVYDALKLAFDAHSGQKRRSGEPFIIHPVEVARILGELELDWESIAAGLLHDTVEDTDVVTFDRIEKEFGTTVRNIVEGETKVSKLGKIQCKGQSNTKQDVKADDLRQMFLAMTDEVRVIIVKLADRLHNMRTLSHMPQHKQSAIAMETLQVFAPLAKLLGMYQIKSELEYLSFMYINPSDFSELSKRVEEYYRVHEKELQEAKRLLKEKIEEDQYLEFVTAETEVRSAYKELYSIYKSLLQCMRKGNEMLQPESFMSKFNEMLQSESCMSKVNEMAQLSIIIKPKTREVLGPLCSAQQVCYHVLGLVHGIWTPVPRAVKDYIATPKPNGYQSLHTTVIPFLKESMFRLEVQIRTEEMDLIAERGIAAHYSGKAVVFCALGHKMLSGDTKQGKAIHLNNTGKALRIGWLNAIREWQEEFVGNMSSREFVDTVTRDLLGSRVFVFTPKGEIKNLPKGATVIDYAYLIHTEIGNKMIAAKVNGNHVEPTHVLGNAEVVEIIRSDTFSKAAYENHKKWYLHARTRSARHKIMKFLEEQASLFAKDITDDNVEDFAADHKEEQTNKRLSIFEKINNIEKQSTKIQKDLLHVKSTCNMTYPAANINGSASVNYDKFAEYMQHDIPTCIEMLPGLEIWKAGKIATWHGVEGNSIQWLCVICIDQKEMMSEVTSTLTAGRITIRSCAAEIDRIKGVGVVLFHFEGSYDNLVGACLSMNFKDGILGWSVGCSWMNP